MKAMNFNGVEVYTGFKQPCGGYVCVIKKVEYVDEKSYLKIFYDIVQAYDPKDAEFVGMYEKRLKEKGYDYPINVLSDKQTDDENKNNIIKSMLLGFYTALDNSNGTNYVEQANNQQAIDEQTFVGKKIGFVIGLEEYEGKDRNGAPKIKTRPYVAQRRSVETILSGDFKVPELKKLDQTPKSTPNPFQQAAQTVSTPTPTQPQETPNPFANVGNMAPAPTPMPAEQPMDSDEIPF